MSELLLPKGYYENLKKEKFQKLVKKHLGNLADELENEFEQTSQGYLLSTGIEGVATHLVNSWAEPNSYRITGLIDRIRDLK